MRKYVTGNVISSILFMNCICGASSRSQTSIRHKVNVLTCGIVVFIRVSSIALSTLTVDVRAH